jgi:acetoin utilization protein AcuB
MIVSMWMTRELLTITPDMSVAEAATLMSHRRIRRLPVVARSAGGERLLGMITATDVLHAFPPNVNPFAVVNSGAQRTLTRVGELLLAEPVTVAPDAPIEEAARLMCERKIGGLPVVREGRLVGLITESDIFRAFVSVFSGPNSGVRLTFELAPEEDAFRYMAGIALKHEVQVTSLFISQQNEARVCVVRVDGPGVDKLVEQLWASKHRVLNVLNLKAEEPPT